MQCDICFMQFDLNNHRPKCLPCGHTICLRCMQSPGMKRCPMCMKDLTVDPGDLPDNISLIRMVEKQGAPPPCKVLRREDTAVQQLQRGVDAGRKLVEQLRHLVPLAVEALNRQLDSSVAQLSRMEETLGKLQRKQAPGDEDTPPDLLAGEQFQLVVQLEDSLRLLAATKCRVVAEQSADTWTASVKLGPNHDVMRLLLLQLRADAELHKVAVAVGPPRLSTFVIDRPDTEGRKWKVKDVIKNPWLCENIRVLQNLTGAGSAELLRVIRVVAPQLEELEMSESVDDLDAALKQAVEMPSLKRLIIGNSDQEFRKLPDLPLQLEELELWSPNEQQMLQVQHMPRLRSLMVYNYYGDNVSFPPSLHEGLTWLGLCLNVDHKTTMLTLIRAHSKSLRELRIHCEYEDDNDDWCFFFPHLGQDLATCGLHGLTRLVLQRSYFYNPCPEVEACLLQRRAVRSFLPSSIEVLCRGCPPGPSVMW
ncbi:uncharacterized protein LOC113209900 isoform X2 [Frankliniella occidentalis]|nr:uncharacterized protein LOC113209900 isoform X2 [Frankliniella occidentalis]